MNQLPVQVQPVVQRPQINQVQQPPKQQTKQVQQPQIRVVQNKLSRVQLALLGAFLFFVFANPEIFSFANKVFPGVIMNYAGKVTQSGTITHAVVFGVVFFGLLYFLERPTVEGFIEGACGKKRHP